MKKTICNLFLLLSVIMLGAAENIEMKTSRYAKKTQDGNFEFALTPENWCEIKGVLPVKKGMYYTFDAKITPGSDVSSNFLVTLQATGNSDPKYNRHRDFSIEPGKTVDGRIFIYATDDGNISVRIASRGRGQSGTLKISEIHTAPFTPEMLNRMKLDEIFKSPWFCVGKGGTMSEVSTADHLDGGTGTLFRSEDGKAALSSPDLPLLPNSQYELTFWAKSSKENKVIVWVDGWTSGKKHWYVKNSILAEKGFRQYTIKFQSDPDIDRYRGMVRIRFTPEANNDLIVKGIELHQLAK